MSRLKKEILGKLKEYAGKMGRDHLGGDDIASPKRGGLRDFDGYDNVQYNKDMPMDEMQVVNKKTGKDITKHVLALLSGKIDKKKFEKIVEKYLADNYKKMISPMLQRRDLGKGAKVHTPESAVKEQKKRIMDYYLG